MLAGWSGLPRLLEDKVGVHCVDEEAPYWGIFGRTISTHFFTVSSLSMFSIIQPSLYVQLPDIYLGVGFEFGPQRI